MRSASTTSPPSAPPVGVIVAPLQDRDRAGRSADRARERQRWRREEDLVPAGLRACLGQTLEVEHLTEHQAHVGECRDVEWLSTFRLLVGPYLDAPGIACDGGDAMGGKPGDRVEAEPGSIAARVGAPAVPSRALELTGPQQQDVALADLAKPVRCGR